MSLASQKSPTMDPNLIPRVKQYLEDNVHKTYVDVEEMTQSLMNRYQEYSRRKLVPFRILVEQAYKTVLHSYGLDSNPGSDAEASDLEVMDDANNGNHMNNALNSLYMKKANNPGTSDGAAISIDISSDEEDSGTAKQKVTIPIDSTKVTVTKISANGSKSIPSAEELVNIIKSRPGPASQKKRRLEALEDKLKPTAATTTTSLATPATSSSASSLQPKPKKFKKEVFAKKSSVTFDDIGGMNKTLTEICELILHIKHPEMYRQIGLTPPRGFLLHGQPGTGKSLLAHAIAGQLDVLLIEVPATELVAGVSGESEERIREIFEQAASFAPCVLFIDDIDTISSNRQTAQKDMERRIVAQLLSSLDSLSKLKYGDQVLVIGATSRPDALDPALRRVGRFDHEISLGIPDREQRTQILEKLCKDLRIARPFDYEEIALLTPGYVGADLMALTIRAASNAIKRAVIDKERKLMEGNKTAPKVVEPIVNLDDDLLMEVDDSSKVNEASDPKNNENKPQETEKADTNPENEEPVVAEITAEAAKETPVDMDTEEKVTENEPPKAEIAESEPTAIQPDMKVELKLDIILKWLQNEVQLMTEEDLEKLIITREDFLEALKHVQPSAKREGFITVPDVTWNDIGSLRDIRSELELAILAPVKFPKRMQKLGLKSPSGTLLCGPPGCGKTLLAKAIANEAGINFISVKGPELLNMYVGESERAVRQCFQRARNSAPCVIFFDEFDSLCPKRSDSGDNNASQRVVNQLLTEMDGIEERKGVFLMAATNRPDIIDPAVLRPGRLDKIMYVGMPDVDDRIDILRALTKNGTMPELAEDVDLQEISVLSKGYTGADLAGLVREASLQALKISKDTNDTDDDICELKVHKQQFLDALSKLKPSVREQDIAYYEKLKKIYGTN